MLPRHHMALSHTKQRYSFPPGSCTVRKTFDQLPGDEMIKEPAIADILLAYEMLESLNRFSDCLPSWISQVKSPPKTNGQVHLLSFFGVVFQAWPFSYKPHSFQKRTKLQHLPNRFSEMLAYLPCFEWLFFFFERPSFEQLSFW